MAKYMIKSISYNPYIGFTNDSESLFSFRNFSDFSWDYVLDEANDRYENTKEYYKNNEPEMLKTLVKPHWKTKIEDEDTDVTLIVGKVNNKNWNGLVVEDKNTVTGERYYIVINSNFYKENLKEYLNTTDSLQNWDSYFCNLIDSNENIFDKSKENFEFEVDNDEITITYPEDFDDDIYGFYVSLKIENTPENLEKLEDFKESKDFEDLMNVKFKLTDYDII